MLRLYKYTKGDDNMKKFVFLLYSIFIACSNEKENTFKIGISQITSHVA